MLPLKCLLRVSKALLDEDMIITRNEKHSVPCEDEGDEEAVEFITIRQLLILSHLHCGVRLTMAQ